MPQRFKDFGRVALTRMYQSITTAGDLTEGPVTLPEAPTHLLEIVAQNYKSVFIEGRNNDTTNTVTQKIFATRKFNESVPATGNSFWTETADHWELIDTQTDIATTTNAVVKEFVDKGFTYMVVCGDAEDGAFATGTITLASVLAADTVTVNGLVYTAVAGAKSDNTEFSIDGSDTVDATDLADSITNDSRTGITEATLDQTGAGASAVVTVTCTTKTALGNNIDLAESTAGARITLSGALLTGGLDTTSQYISRAILTTY